MRNSIKFLSMGAMLVCLGFTSCTNEDISEAEEFYDDKSEIELTATEGDDDDKKETPDN